MNKPTLKSIFEREDVSLKLREMLGKKAVNFATSVLQIVNDNKLLASADALSVYNAAMMAATLDLPINKSLGFAWIVPYQGQAQFQIGWKGFVQLAQRTGEYLKINCCPVYESQFIAFNYLTEELEADFTAEPGGKVIGYAAYFELKNGFTKTVYWTKKQVDAHGKRFSKSYSNGSSPWSTDYDAMAMKTVMKNALAKWGILSIEMQKAQIHDQSVIKDYESDQSDYVDSQEQEVKELPKITEKQLKEAIEEIKQGNTTAYAINEQYDIEQDVYEMLMSYEPKGK